MTAAADGRLAEVTIDTLEKLAFLFASPVEAAPEVEESLLTTVRVEFTGAFAGGMEVSPVRAGAGRAGGQHAGGHGRRRRSRPTSSWMP